MSTPSIAKTVNTIYAIKDNFIVIGLTGRTGSGCSTVSNILKTNSFDDLDFPQIPFHDASLEDRKDQVIYKWTKTHWKSFSVIQVSHLIFCCMLANEGVTEIQFDNIKEHIPQDTLLKIKKYRSTIESTHRTSAEKDELKQFLFCELPDIFNFFKNKISQQELTPLLQSCGDALRTINQYFIPDLIYKIINATCLYNEKDADSKVRFTIDALRNPYEILYLKERIAQFYVFAVTTPDDDRRERLIANNYTSQQIEDLDKKEYPSEKRVGEEKMFVSQDIQACLNLADVYISNPKQKTALKHGEITRQLCRYISLIQHPGLVTPTSIERCMQIAFSAKVNSGCISRQVGAVVTDKNLSIRSVGWNDVPKGQVPCSLRNAKHLISTALNDGTFSAFELDDKFRNNLSLNEKKSNGRTISFCFKSVHDDGKEHTRALHAEENAFMQIVKYGGQPIQGGVLFTTSSPCELCAKKAYQLEISKIYYIDPYPGISEKHVLGIGKSSPELILFNGAIGRSYHKIFEPIIPLKDEFRKLGIGLAKAPSN